MIASHDRTEAFHLCQSAGARGACEGLDLIYNLHMKRILPIWQPVGYSTHIIAKKVSDRYKVKTSHTGTLDPMAKGVIIILLGDERLKKKEYAKWLKEYSFDIAFGISTDTYDGLGLIKDVVFLPSELSLKQFKLSLSEVLSDFKGDYSQEVPPFSAIKVKGKPMHWYARRKRLDGIKIPRRKGKIYDIYLDGIKEVLLRDLVHSQVRKIKSVTGDLRQELVISGWQEFLFGQSRRDLIKVARIGVKISKGMYVRSLSQDVCRVLEVHGFVSNLVRLKNGIYGRKESKSLSEIFGSDFKDEYDFVSRM